MSNQSIKQQAKQSPPLRGVRIARGLTLAEVAETANVHVSTLSEAERGLVALSVAQLYRVAKALGLDEVSSPLRPFVVSDEDARGQE